MRKAFHQFFRPTKTEMGGMLAEALICYDANVLLNVYRYSEDTQTGLLDVFRTFASRTRLPHQVALEYARNRAQTIVDQSNHCKDTEKAFKKIVDDYITPKNKQPFLSAESELALKKIVKELENKRRNFDALIGEDEYVDLLDSLFDNIISPAPDHETLKKMHEKAQERYARKQPPGYSDLKNKAGTNAYGDYIVWRQLMDIAISDQKDFIFVTDDNKEDWRLRHCGKTIGPCPELLDEFRQVTGQRVWLFTSEGFLIAAREAGLTQVSDTVVKEVGEHLHAQASTLTSEGKRSTPSVDYDDVKLMESSNKVLALTNKRTAIGNEEDGGEE